MKITRKICEAIYILVFCIGGVCDPSLVIADKIYAPDYLWARHIAEKTDPVGIADTHVGIAYRDDGALDSRGYFTTFSDQTKIFDTPGLNCSGLVVSVSRFLFNRNWTLDEVTRDRQGNSGADSPSGKDWDFGWDLIFNVSEGSSRRVIMPDPGSYSLESSDGVSLRGFDLHDVSAWQKVLPQMRPGRLYLGSISTQGRGRGAKVLHYHVVLLLPDERGGVQLYHATRRSRVHKININSPQGLNRFLSQFAGARGDAKSILVVEAILPDMSTTSDINADSKAKESGSQASAGATTGGQAPQSLALGQSEGDKPLGNTKNEALETASQPVDKDAAAPDSAATKASLAQSSKGPDVVVNHLSGKVFHPFPDLVTHIPRFADESKTAIEFSFRNRGQNPRNVQIYLRGPSGDFQYAGEVPIGARDLSVLYPRDFSPASTKGLVQGEYLADVRIDGTQWCGNLFEIASPREAQPKIVNVKAPSSVQTGKTFTVVIEAQNLGAESDYGGITVSSPDPSGLRLLSAKPGRIYSPGSTVLSVTSDRIRTKVPMAERWIELWGEKKSYDLQVQVQAGKPGTYALYVRCALRGVNVKSSVILMDPSSGDTVDQQGFPAYVFPITVK